MNDLKYLVQLMVGFFIFVLMLYIIGLVAKDSCIEKIKDKPAAEIKLICN